MADTRPTPSPLPRLRAAGPCAQRSAASMLRLSHTGDSRRLPSGPALAGWLRRAAVALHLDPVPTR